MKQYFIGHEVLGLTYLPRQYGRGREYFWMKDIDGTIYLVKAKRTTDDGIIDGYIPDFS